MSCGCCATGGGFCSCTLTAELIPLGFQNANGGAASPAASPSPGVIGNTTSSNVYSTVTYTADCPIDPTGNNTYSGQVSQALAAQGLQFLGWQYAAGVITVSIGNPNNLDINTISASIGEAVSQAGLASYLTNGGVASGGIMTTPGGGPGPGTGGGGVYAGGAGPGGGSPAPAGPAPSPFKFTLPAWWPTTLTPTNVSSIPWWVWAIVTVVAILLIKGIASI